MEDDAFSYRVSPRFRNIYRPSARLAHYASSSGGLKEFGKKRMLVRNHCYLFRKNSPQTLQHRVAFSMSLPGLVLEAIVCENVKGRRGIVAGLGDVFRKQ